MKKKDSSRIANGEETWQCNNTKEVAGGKIIQCLEENPHCNNFFYYGSTIFCKKTLQNKLNQTNSVMRDPSIITQLKKNVESF